MIALPIRMIIPCPACGRRHLDEGPWATRVHTSHLCLFCGVIWKPCNLPTVGVASLCEHEWQRHNWFDDRLGVCSARMCRLCNERHPDDALTAVRRDPPPPPPGEIPAEMATKPL